MSSNKKLVTLLIASILFTACKITTNIPKAYNFTFKEAKTISYGSWTILQIKSEQNLNVSQEIAGELLYKDADTVYVLIQDRIVRPIYSGSIINAELYTHNNLSGKYFGITTLLLAPNLIGAVVQSDFSMNFLQLGIPMAVMGLAQTIIEDSSKNNRLFYPSKDNLESFAHFARFPAGKPVNIDFKQLILRKVEE